MDSPATPTLSSLQTHARRLHAEFPQYDHAWDRHVLCRVSALIETKFGVAFAEGEIAMAAPNTEPLALGGLACEMRSVYSVRNNIDTLVPASMVETLPLASP